MSNTLVAVGYDLWVVALSYLIACFASYVALDLAKRVRTPDRAMAAGWWACGSLAMGTGIWAMHFVGMLAMEVPFAVGYGHAVTGLSWVAGVGVSAIALYIASFRHLRLLPLTAGALAMGAGICAMHYTGMAALDMAPGIRWDWALIGVSAAIAVTASAVALLIFFWLRKLTGAAARRWQFAAALVMGAAICGMHYTGMAAAGFAEGSICRSADQLRGDGLSLLVTVASLVLLTLTMLGAVLDSRLQGRSTRLAASLQTANTELQRLAFRDALTGLPNRLLFDERVTSAVERSTRSSLGLAVLFVDLDGFKPVNDSFGHALGDEVLQEIAHRLQALTRGSDTVARVGGDEFVLLLEEMDGQGAAATAQRIIDACSAPVARGGHELRLSCSVGIAVFPTDGPRDQLLAHADAAMYAAKRAGGSTYAFFEPRMNAGIREQIELQRDLRSALAHGGELELHYQPKVHSASGVITGVEALVRWRHPQRGLLAPGLFIPVAERFGLIASLGDWVIDEACRQLRAWLDSGLQLRMAINLSVVQLRQDELVDKVRQALLDHRLEGARLTFEITESVAMDDAESTLRAFEDLATLGVRLSIDDFGTGYSSLAYLRKLRAGQLKIDRSFVQDLDSSADARAIVDAVVRLSHSLGLNVVAEGVETAAQRAVLAELGCDELQGYFFARPMPAHVLAEWAADQGRPQVLHFADSAYVDAAETAPT